ncbi:MAG: InlB B-repeat-containing protein, partial [Clostridiales bacterium]|nr:InlB B-repeat-containing protein [Clostridiales bacterium]
MKHTGKMMSAALLLGTIGCLCGGISQLNASADGTPDWIQMTANNRYIYTLDGSTKEDFVFNTANNAFNKTICVDLGMQSDGETELDDQCYVLSKFQFASLQNVTSLTVKVSTDDVNYTTALATSDVSGQWKVIDFPTEVNARYVQVQAEGAWATMWGEYPFALYGYAGELAVDTDPQGLTLAGIDEETVYPMVKGDTLQLNAQMSNLYGEGEITYVLADEVDGISVTADGLLTIGAVGDGETEYTVTASVPNPSDEDAPYTASMKFVVLEEELANYSTYYLTDGAYDLLDYIAIDVARVYGDGTIEYSVDGTNYTALTANEVLTMPVVARYIGTSNEFALYGTTTALAVEEVTSEDINGFYPEHPLFDLIDGDLLTIAQAPDTNLLGADEVLGSITLELDGYHKINAVRVFLFYNSIKSGFISFSLDGVNFTNETALNFHYVACKLGADNAEFMDIAIPEGEVAAKYVRLNITATSDLETSIAVREFNAYGETMPEVTLGYNANTEDEVTGVPQGGEIAFGAIVDEPTAPVREGYAFKGWYKDEACEEIFDFDAPVFEDTTLYASWIEVYTVSFEVNGGSAVTAVSVENGSAVTAPENPTKEGYAFKGWYADEELTTAYDFEAAVTGNLTVYAKWNAVYTVTFDCKGGSA